MADLSSAPDLAAELRRALDPRRILDDAAAARLDRDAGVFRLRPMAVVRPESEAEVAICLHAARMTGTPVVARAGGSNTGGAAITNGLLILFDDPGLGSVQMNRSLGTATCGPAARHNAVQRALDEAGLHLPSDPSSGPLSRIGGNVATRASGPHALRHGAINRYVRHIRFITAAGEVIDTRDGSTLPRRIAHGLIELARQLASDGAIRRRLESRRDMKWASGYELLALLDHPDDPIAALPRLLTGSVGTLGILTECEVAGTALPGDRVALLLRFVDERSACAAAGSLREHAQAVEIVSQSAVRLLRRRTDALGEDGMTGALLIVEYTGTEAYETAKRSASSMRRSFRLSTEPEIAGDQQRIDGIWRARKALLPIISAPGPGTGIPYSVVNDVGVAPERLADLLEAAERIFARHGLESAVYGHAGSGNLHLRPFFPAGDLGIVAAVAADVYRAVTDLGGTITAEHGMGRLRAPFLQQEWGEPIVGAMRRLKNLFDPDGLLNPDVLFVPPGHRFETDGWPQRPVLLAAEEMQYSVGP